MADVSPSTLLSRANAQNNEMRELLEKIAADLETLATKHPAIAKALTSRATRIRFRLQQLPPWKP